MGNTQGLKPSQIKALNRLTQRRYPNLGGFSPEQARELAALSHDTGRQLGILIDRVGKPHTIIVGTPDAIFIPDISRARYGAGRLRGLRLLHTHLSRGLLSDEDLMDMLFLRLDSVGVLSVDKQGDPVEFQYAALLPENPENKPYQVNEPLPWSQVFVDFAAEVEALEDELSRQQRTRDAEGEAQERVILVSVSTMPWKIQEDSLDELAALAETAGLNPAGRLMQRVSRINPKFILGRGKLAELEVLALQKNAGVIVFDCELSPAQFRNLAEVTERKVLDRTQLILDIFAQHATSRAGKLQVEMAQLKYTMPRLVGKNKAMSRLMGGIGGRGPGETKLEIDRRRIRDRLGRIKGELKKLRSHRAHARARRDRAGVPVAALVGYTNAGKSTLLNTLTRSDVLAENKLFATLDPTTRRLRFPQERELIITDTVGFIRYLPDELKEAFSATLEELSDAELLIHVADAGHPNVEEQVKAVDGILESMELGEIQRVLVLNKWDSLDAEQKQTARNLFPGAIPASALTREGLRSLSWEIIRRVGWESMLENGECPHWLAPCEEPEAGGAEIAVGAAEGVEGVRGTQVEVPLAVESENAIAPAADSAELTGVPELVRDGVLSAARESGPEADASAVREDIAADADRGAAADQETKAEAVPGTTTRKENGVTVIEERFFVK